MNAKNAVKIKKKNHLLIFFTYILIVTLLAMHGCSASQTEHQENVSAQSVQSSEETESREPMYAPFQYEAGEHYCNDLLKDVVGDEVLKAAYDVIDAFTAHENSVKVKFTGYYGLFTENLGFALNCIYPPFSACADYNSLHAYNEKDGTVSWKYKFDKSKCDEIRSACEKATENYMSYLREGDTNTAKALLLYNALTKDAVYDYDVLLIDTETNYEIFDERTTAYNALVNKSGICYSYSFALVYLYMNAGINCIPVSSQEGDGAHMWVMVKLNDKYYYIDPTWDIGGGFYHFGMTSYDRASWAGSYAEDTCFAHAKPIKQNYVIEDERFFDMRLYLTNGGSYTIEIDREKQEVVISDESTSYRLDCR